MSIDAMKQALAALEGWANHGEWVWPESALEQAKRNTTESITALRAAIEQAQGLAEKIPVKGTVLEQTLKDVWDEMPHTALMDAIIGGTGVMLGDKRIDPASIYKQPEQEPVAWVYQEGLEALKSGRPWTAYGSNGGGRIPLYLNDAVAPRAEPRSGESGAGFESLPASPTTTWWDDPVPQMRREWQGLTDEELNQIYAEPQTHAGQYARAIEARLKEKNHG